MEGSLQTKEIGEGFKDVDVEKGIVTGYFAAFGSKDSDGDIIVKGAFAESILKHGPKSSHPRIKHLLDHSRTKAVAKILELKEDDFGLYYESKAGSHTDGQDFLKMVQDGLITEHSHGFIPQVEEQKSDANYIIKSFLMEGSSLQFWGANSNTPIVSVKNYEKISEQLDKITKSIKSATYTDETFKMLYGRIDELYKQANEIKASLTKENPLAASIIKYL